MKLVIAGPRDLYVDSDTIKDGLSEMGISVEDIEELINGGATGVDQSAKEWCESLGEEPTVIEADWDEAERVYGNRKAAGPIRNREMAALGDALLVIKRSGVESRGTSSMIKEAIAAGIPYYVKEV